MMLTSITTAAPDHWPGVAALLPVLGTMLVLLAQRQNALLTSPTMLQRLGDWSYSIYLWHWPVVVALVYVGWQGKAGAIIAGLGMSLLLGWASYRWIEPLGRKLLTNWRTASAIAAFVFAALLVAVPALGIRLKMGVPGRLNPEVEAAATRDHNPLRKQSHSLGGMVFNKHVYGGPNIRAIVWGDSHADAIVTAVQAALEEPQDGVLGMSYTSCPTVFGLRQERKDRHCAEFNEWAMQQMVALPADVPVIIANRGSYYLHGDQYAAHAGQATIYFESPTDLADKGYSHFLEEFTRHYVTSVCRVATTRPVYLLRPIPEMPVDVPRALARAVQLGRSTNEIAMPLADYHRRNADIWAAQDAAVAECKVHTLNPLPSLCPNGICSAADGKIPRYYDDDHLSEQGNRHLIGLFKTAL